MHFKIKFPHLINFFHLPLSTFRQETAHVQDRDHHNRRAQEAGQAEADRRVGDQERDPHQQLQRQEQAAARRKRYPGQDPVCAALQEPLLAQHRALFLLVPVRREARRVCATSQAGVRVHSVG